MELVLANTLEGLSRYLHEQPADLLVVHGDRVEALAGAIAGALRNVLVAHVEGGELSGTVDELLRHAVTKLSHLHFVANPSAGERLRQLGEAPERIFVIGSPDIDIMLSGTLPTRGEAERHYDITFPSFGLVLYHPVTTRPDGIEPGANALVDALVQSGRNYVVIYPNNDEGADHIFSAYRRLAGDPHFLVFPSLRFEYFLTLLKHADFIIGNSSAGVREAPVFGVPAINLGDRQRNRHRHSTIIDVPEEDAAAITAAITDAASRPQGSTSHHFGDGHSTELFMAALRSDALWTTSAQKQFLDLAAFVPT
jgi:UDP-N-acetylglucosamine 2-epimerase (hydrolysing)